MSLLESIGKVLSNAYQQLLASKSGWAYQEKDSKFWQEHFVKHEYQLGQQDQGWTEIYLFLRPVSAVLNAFGNV